jgi:hypothetical protein
MRKFGFNRSKTGIFRMARVMCVLAPALLTTGTAQAKILRVNNDTGVQLVSGYVFRTLGDAVTAAAAKNDTIHIEGSVTPYTEDVVINKRVFIFGPGYFLSTTAQTQYLKQPARLDGKITFAAGSEGSVLAGIEQKTGSISTYAVYANPGMGANTYNTGNRIVINADTVKVINCKLFFVQIENKYLAADKTLNNVAIQKCFFNPGVVVVTGGGT